jgi:hypothetical protein
MFHERWERFVYSIRGSQHTYMSDEKSIIVRVVDWTSGTEMITHQPQTVLVNATGGVQAAVKQVYPVFPGVRTLVMLQRGPTETVLLWHKNQRPWPSPRDSYELLQDGDVVEIQLYAHPTGPDRRSMPGWMPDGADAVPADEYHEPGRGEGPHGARLVTALLRQLETLQ